MGAMRPWHIIVLVIVLIIVFGASKLPDIAQNIGKSAKVLKKEMKELTDDDQKANPPQVSGSQPSDPAAPQNAQQQNVQRIPES